MVDRQYHEKPCQYRILCAIGYTANIEDVNPRSKLHSHPSHSRCLRHHLHYISELVSAASRRCGGVIFSSCLEDPMKSLAQSSRSSTSISMVDSKPLYATLSQHYSFWAFLALHFRRNFTSILQNLDYASLVDVDDLSRCLRSNVEHFQPPLELCWRHTADRTHLQPRWPVWTQGHG